MLTFWNLPIQSDRPYLANSIGRREGGYSYLKSLASWSFGQRRRGSDWH